MHLRTAAGETQARDLGYRRGESGMILVRGRLNSLKTRGSCQGSDRFVNRLLVFDISWSMPPMSTILGVIARPKCHGHAGSKVTQIQVST